MTSITSYKSQIPVNALYTNIASAVSSIFQENGSLVVPWLEGLGAASTAGALQLRDMGKTVYVPAPDVPTTNGYQSTIMRKVQLITNAPLGTGANALSGTAEANGYYTGYIKLAGQTYGGGQGYQAGVTVFVRAN